MGARAPCTRVRVRSRQRSTRQLRPSACATPRVRGRRSSRARASAIRVDESRWSDLEYGCHVRDVYRVMDGRLASMLNEDDPLFPELGSGRDRDQRPLRRAGSRDGRNGARAARRISLLIRIDAIEPNEWSRPGTRSNGSRFTVETLVRYALHDLLHHQWDVSRD